jgi:hypothetical protein
MAELKIFDIASTPAEPMDGRGTKQKFVDASLGTERLDVHLNRLLPGGARGKLHKHSKADNVYIVRAGKGELRFHRELKRHRSGARDSGLVRHKPRLGVCTKLSPLPLRLSCPQFLSGTGLTSTDPAKREGRGPCGKSRVSEAWHP